MKKVIMTMIMVLLMAFIVNADTCSFLDSDGDCITGMQDLIDVQGLAMLQSINCAWSNCQYTLDANGDGVVDMQDVLIIQKLTMLQNPSIDGAPSAINLELINDNTQVRMTVTDSDGTPRSDIGVDITIIEFPGTYDGVVYTDANGEGIVDIPSELLTQTFTGKAWFDADAQKQIPYTENTITYTYNPPPPPSSPSSGGGGGGSSTPTCEDRYFECSDWGECTGTGTTGTQTRTCEKTRSCRGDYEPETSTSCYNWNYVKEQQAKENVNNALKSEPVQEIKEAPKATGAAIAVSDGKAAKGFWRSIWSWFISLFQ